MTQPSDPNSSPERRYVQKAVDALIQWSPLGEEWPSHWDDVQKAVDALIQWSPLGEMAGPVHTF